MKYRVQLKEDYTPREIENKSLKRMAKRLSELANSAETNKNFQREQVLRCAAIALRQLATEFPKDAADTLRSCLFVDALTYQQNQISPV